MTNYIVCTQLGTQNKVMYFIAGSQLLSFRYRLVKGENRETALQILLKHSESH